MNRGKIAIIGTLDTKETEAFYLKEILHSLDYEGTVFNASLTNWSPTKSPDVDQNEILSEVDAHPSDLDKLNRDQASQLMEKGLGNKLKNLQENGEIQGVIGYGGSVGSRLIIGALKYLPTSFPKVIVTTVQNIVKEYIDKNIAIIPSPVDFIGGDELNTLEKKVFSAAASSISALVDEFSEIETKDTIFITQMGTTTKCVTQCRNILNEKGFEVVTFHAAGLGGECFEEFIERGVASGVLDITTAEISNSYVGGLATPKVDRINASIKKKIPTVICPGSMDNIVFDGPGTKKIPRKFKDREFFYHNPSVTLMRMNKSESIKVGEIVAERVNKFKSPVRILFPEKGWSEYDKKGGIKMVDYTGKETGNEWFKPEANKAFLKSLKENVDPKNENIKIISLNNHINDFAFSENLCEALLDIYWYKDKNKNK